MRLVALPQAEGGAEVRGEELLLLNGGDEGLVHRLLVVGAASGELLLLGLLTLLEESLLTLLLLCLVSAPVRGLRDLVEDLALQQVMSVRARWGIGEEGLTSRPFTSTEVLVAMT